MRLTLCLFRIFILLGAFFLLFSIAATAQTKSPSCSRDSLSVQPKCFDFSQRPSRAQARRMS